MVAAAVGIGTAVAGIGSAALGASSANKAGKRAAESAAESNALQREIYDRNTANLSPFMNRGNAAGDQINALLGLPTPKTVDWGAYVRGNPDALANWNAIRNNSDGAIFGGDIAKFGQFHYDGDGAQRDLTPYTTGGQASVSPAAAQDAFRGYIDNSDYAFRQAEGDRGLNAGYAARGLLESGAAIKALEGYRQNLQKGYRNEYLGYLGGQQSVGLSAANALAGVGSTYAGNVGANNAASAGAQINASLASANAINRGIGTAAQGLTNALSSSFGGSSGAGGYDYMGAGARIGSFDPYHTPPYFPGY